MMEQIQSHPSILYIISMQEQNQIITSYRRVYTIAQKVFCCKCFGCCQDVSIVNSHIRKQTLQRMIKTFVIDEHEVIMYDPIKLMILIYLCADEQIPKKHLQKCRVNPNLANDSYRTDLEFYIPQMCNYIVFHSDLSHNYLLDGVEKACKMSFYFGHLYYFYMISLEKIIEKDEVQILKKAFQYRQGYLEEMCKFYEGANLSSIELYGGFKTNIYSVEPEIGFFIKVYGTKDQISLNQRKQIDPKDIALPRYSSLYSTEETQIFSFKSTINFFDDLFNISEDLKNTENKKQALKKALMLLNQKLPACVYIPFTKGSIRLCNVLNIVASECRVFSTKERAPYYICVEVFSPAEILDSQQQEKYWEKVETPFTFTQTFRSESLLNRKNSFQRPRRTSRGRSPPKHEHDHRYSDPYSETIRTQIMTERQNKFLNNQLLKFANEMETQPRLKYQKNNSIQLKQLQKDDKMRKALAQIFGEDQSQFKQRIKNKSIFGHFESWNLVHLIVKTHDNLKQQQFALQLIYEFYYIFKLQKLPLILTPYEVLSMGPDYGIIQMVRESVTFDSLKKKLRTEFSKPLTLKQFFELNYAQNLAEAKETFMKSLAAYSLVMYFLQAKDRHNGNILLHKSGKLLHIDFGFFLSNLPGKGVQLEKVCPFKLLTEHIEVLDGPESYYFKKFRQYFFLGFKAARKHQNKILILVKMMYTSSGMTMPCFEKGQLAITQIQNRFNPPGVINDAQLNLHCQKLIDSSLDNWAAKWYDRWQYLAQGIFY